MSQTILVVDDEPDLRLMLRVKLKQQGFEVTEAVDGAEALEILTHTTPDLVLLDLRMPDIDGWSVLETLRERGRLDDLKVVTISAHAGAGTVERTSALGVQAHVSKPFLLKALIDVIHDVLAC